MSISQPLTISAIRTTTTDIWTPAPAFGATSPFAIVMDIELTANPPWLPDSFAATWIMGTPRQDPYTDSWYTILPGNNGSLMPTVVFDWNFEWDYRRKGKNFSIWISFDQYLDAVSQIYGSEKEQGIFYVMGTLASEGTGYFAVSDKFWYRVVD